MPDRLTGASRPWSPWQPWPGQCWQPQCPCSSSCLLPPAQCSCLAHHQCIWHRSCWSTGSAANASFSPLTECSPPSWLSTCPQRETRLPWHSTAWLHPVLLACLTQKVSVWAGWRGGEGRTCPFGKWWDCGLAEQPLLCFQQGIILPILLHKSHLFCKNPSAWLPRHSDAIHTLCCDGTESLDGGVRTCSSFAKHAFKYLF